MNVKFVFSLAMAAALSALAETETANVIGVLRVDSSNSETIVSVPWVATSAEATDSAIPVTDIVKTAGLATGDELEYYNPSTGKYQCWQLSSSGQWVAAQSVGEGGEVTPSDAALTRGNAIILVRKSDIQDHFYLQGQVAKTGSATCTMTRSANAVAYSLIAPPTVDPVGLNVGTWTNVAAGDFILVRGKKFVYDSTTAKWGTYATNPTTFEKTFTTTEATISVGQGAWYVSAAGTTAATVTWPNLPSVQ